MVNPNINSPPVAWGTSRNGVGSSSNNGAGSSTGIGIPTDIATTQLPVTHDIGNHFDQITVSMDSNTHPLYLHNNDQPGIQLISKKLTGSDNYNPWQRSMAIALSAKNKMGIVNGFYEIPATTSPIFAQWERVNDMVTSWILNCVSEEISNSMNFIHTAASVWKELKDHFSTVDGHRIYQLLRDLYTLEQGTASVDFYYHKMKGIWDEYLALETRPLCTCGASRILDEQDQRRKLTQFLMGLEESYANARGQILMMQPLPNVAQAFALIRQDERQRQGYVPGPNSSTAMFAHSANLGKQQMTYGSGHDMHFHNISSSTNMDTNPGAYYSSSIQTATSRNYQQYPHSVQAATSKHYEPPSHFHKTVKDGWCTYCHKDGHIREDCYRLNGYPPGHPAAKWTKQRYSFSPNVSRFQGSNHFSTKKNLTLSGYKAQSQSSPHVGKAMQVSTVTDDDSGSDPIQHLQAQMNQLFSMLDKIPDSPYDHVAGPTSDAHNCNW